MNYPQNYAPASGPTGAPAFWANFPFIFDANEVVHLRHAFRKNVVMGGEPWASGAGRVEMANVPIEDNSGLRLELEARRSFAFGEPVVVEIKLKTTDMRGKTVYGSLHPNYGFVNLVIQKPGGQVLTYQPFIAHCSHQDSIVLDTERPTIYESSYIGYGKDGFYFDQPGFYRIRATYNSLDGSEVVSNILSLRVRTPLNDADDEVADLYFGEDLGKLFYLLGSDSGFLNSGNEALDLMLDKYVKHPLAVYAKMIKGINASREFKNLTSDKKIVLRKPERTESVKLLSEVVDISEIGTGVDNITLNMTMRCLGRTQKLAGDKKGANATKKRMIEIFRKKSLKPYVMQLIEAQAAEI